VAVALVLGACSAGRVVESGSPDGGRGVEGGGSASSCAFVVHFRGHAYSALTVAIEPVPGPVLVDALMRGCNDTGQQSPPGEEHLRVAELPGVDPDVAVVWVDSPDRVFVREGVDPLPPAVAELVHAPDCNPRDAPVRLRGPWLGIIGADGKTELDLVPPYNLMLRVDEASAARYERAHLVVRVPPELGTPITHADIRSSLWEPGTITVTTTCEGDRFIAVRVQAFPPE
jgi:hypothetical protein